MKLIFRIVAYNARQAAIKGWVLNCSANAHLAPVPCSIHYFLVSVLQSSALGVCLKS